MEMTTSRVLTMEYVPGIKINDIAKIEEAKIDRKLLAKRSAESYLTQLCRHGYFRKLYSFPKTIYIYFIYFILFFLIFFLYFLHFLFN
jgi:hypothetical protein